MYGLEYALFFGVPKNKIELIEGESHWVMPFATRDEGEAHFQEWLATFRRWKQVQSPTPIEISGNRWLATIAGIQLELFPCPIAIRIPIPFQTFRALRQTFYLRDFWPGQPMRLDTGIDSPFDAGDIRINLWRMLMDFCDRHGGDHGSRVDVAIGERANVSPELVYYRPGREKILIEGQYFGAAPDLIADVLMASSRATTRGPRQEVYRRAGIPHWWVLEPADETIEVYELHSQFELIGKYGVGDSFVSPIFPDETIVVASLFETQRKRHPDRWDQATDIKPTPEWIVPAEIPIGLECFFHLGHPDHRWEYWDKRGRSVLAFGSSKEASARFDHFLTEVCAWEAAPRPNVSTMEPDVEFAEVGRFHLTRRSRLVHLDIAIDGAKYRQLLATYADDDAWDWGGMER